MFPVFINITCMQIMYSNHMTYSTWDTADTYVLTNRWQKTEDIRKEIRGWHFPQMLSSQVQMEDAVFYYLSSWLMKCHLWWYNVHSEGWRLRSLTDTCCWGLAKNIHPALNIESLHEEEHGFLCAACHYHTHVGWSKWIGWMALFVCVLIKEHRIAYRNGSRVDGFPGTSGVSPESHRH